MVKYRHITIFRCWVIFDKLMARPQYFYLLDTLHFKKFKRAGIGKK